MIKIKKSDLPKHGVLATECRGAEGGVGVGAEGEDVAVGAGTLGVEGVALSIPWPHYVGRRLDTPTHSLACRNYELTSVKKYLIGKP